MTLLDKLNDALVLLESERKDSEVLAELNALCHKLSIPATVIGGMAVSAHGYHRFTKDIDIIVSQSDAYKLANALIANNWQDLGSNTLSNGQLCINICATGVKAGRTTFPPPDHSEPGLTVIDLAQLLKLKVLAGRHRDRTDVIELIKANNIAKDWLEANVQLSSLDVKMLMQLWETAQSELDDFKPVN